MEFANIQLPPHVIAGLYRHSLVLLAEDMNGNAGISESDKLTIEPNTSISTDNKPKVIEKTILPINNSSSDKDILNKGMPIFSNRMDIPSDHKEILNTSEKEISSNKTLPVNEQPDGIKLKYLGGFSKKISIVVAEHFQPHISDGDLAFLGKLLQACQLSLNDVAIINVVSNAALSKKIWELMQPEKMIIFDVEPGSIGLPFFSPNFQVQPWNDCLFLTAPSLQDLQEGTPEKLLLLKRKLWDSLKKMFSL